MSHALPTADSDNANAYLSSRDDADLTQQLGNLFHIPNAAQVANAPAFKNKVQPPSISGPRLQNGSMVIFPNCSRIPCDTPVPNFNETVTRRAVEDTSVDISFDLDPASLMQYYISSTNQWFFCQWRDGRPGAGLEVIQGGFHAPPPGQEPWLTPAHGFPQATREYYAVGFVIPPWVIREFATVHRNNPEFGDPADYEHLERAMTRSITDVRPDPMLVIASYLPINLIGSDVGFHRIRREVFANPEGFDYDRVGVMELMRFDRVELWDGMRQRYAGAGLNLANVLTSLYPRSGRRMGSAFAAYNDSLRQNWSDAFFAAVRRLLDPTHQAIVDVILADIERNRPPSPPPDPGAAAAAASPPSGAEVETDEAIQLPLDAIGLDRNGNEPDFETETDIIRQCFIASSLFQ